MTSKHGIRFGWMYAACWAGWAVAASACGSGSPAQNDGGGSDAAASDSGGGNDSSTSTDASGTTDAGGSTDTDAGQNHSLSLSVSPDPVLMQPGSNATLSIHLTRSPGLGDVQITLVSPPVWLSSNSITLPEGTTDATLSLHAQSPAPGYGVFAVHVSALAQGVSDTQSITVELQGPSGSLDTSFGGNGFTSFGTTGAYHSPRSLALAPNGSLTLGGSVAGSADPNDPTTDSALWRFGVDGTPDNTFGAQGLATYDLSGHSALDGLSAIQSMPDGSILAIGRLINTLPNNDWVAAQFTPGGLLDTSFGSLTGGGTPGPGYRAYDGPASANDVGTALALTADGSAFLTGNVHVDAGDTLAVLKIGGGGAPVAGFGNTAPGLSVPSPTLSTAATSVVVDSHGRVIVGGWSDTNANGRDGWIVRLLPDGTVDSTFGTAGIVDLEISTVGVRWEAVLDVAVDAQDNIYAAGYYTASDGPPYANAGFVTRLRASNGGSDPQWGVGGVAEAMIGSSSVINAIAFRPDGRVVAAGYIAQTGVADLSDPANFLFTVFAFTPSGLSDTAFDSDGAKVVGIAGASVANDVAVMSDGRIVAAGWRALDGGGQAAFAARLWP